MSKWKHQAPQMATLRSQKGPAAKGVALKISSDLCMDVGREGPWGCRRSHSFIKIAIFISWTGLRRPPPGTLLGAFFRVFFLIGFFRNCCIPFVCFVFFCITPVLLLDCLHNCTTSTKLWTQTAAKSRKLRPGIHQDLPPEAGGTVAGRPKASSQWKTLKREH